MNNVTFVSGVSKRQNDCPLEGLKSYIMCVCEALWASKGIKEYTNRLHLGHPCGHVYIDTPVYITMETRSVAFSPPGNRKPAEEGMVSLKPLEERIVHAN